MKRTFRPALGATIATLLMLAVLTGLGVWQLQRLAWKNNLLTQIQAQMAKVPQPMPEKFNDPKAWEYRRVTMAGEFLYNHEMLVKPRTLNGENGAHIITPFRRISGGIVMVNRGWISDDRLKTASRPAGIVQVGGVAVLPQKSPHTPENSPADGDWYWADTAAMAAAQKIKNTAPVLVQVTKKENGVYPAGVRAEVNLRNDHRQYAIFWFGMAFVLLLIYGISQMKSVVPKLEEKHAGL